MTVRELITALLDCNMDDIVIMSKDAEGNYHSPLSAVDSNYGYVPTTTWYGDVGLRQVPPELIDRGYTEEDCYMAPENAIPCVVLGPVN